jgi:PEP-CTERM motif
MRKAAILPALLALAFALLSSQIAQAQGTTYVSSLGLPPTGSSSVGSDTWLAEAFWTGTNGGGYLLDSVQLALTNASGTPSGFTVMIYNNGAGPNGVSPGTNLYTLNGSLDPVAGGVYTYSPGSSLALLPYRFYFIVLTAGTPVASGAYEWNVTSTRGYITSGGWGAPNNLMSSSDGVHWGFPSPAAYAQFAISATPVPEPSTLALLALGGGFLLWQHRKVKPADTA